jgi:hypothetical protein
MGTLIPKYNNNLLMFVRFIDDMFGIWIDCGTSDAWNNFKQDVNNFGILEWEIEEPSDSVDFLDLTLFLKNRRIATKTYQKALNLYQYLTPTSNHPPRMMRGIIHSLLSKYHEQNSDQDDYVAMATKLFRRHVARGWDKRTMKQWILDADAKISSTPPSLPPSPEQQPILTNKERLFVHLEYHRNDILKAKVRSLYETHCRENFETILGIKQLTVAYSRSKNIRDMVTKAKLHQAPG